MLADSGRPDPTTIWRAPLVPGATPVLRGGTIDRWHEVHLILEEERVARAGVQTELGATNQVGEGRLLATGSRRSSSPAGDERPHQ